MDNQRLGEYIRKFLLYSFYAMCILTVCAVTGLLMGN